MFDCTCPYCEKEIEPSSDQHQPDENHETECPHCGMTFIFTIEYYPSYTTHQVPCLNGEEHDYQKVIGWPEEYSANVRRCRWCDDEVQVTAEEKPSP